MNNKNPIQRNRVLVLKLSKSLTLIILHSYAVWNNNTAKIYKKTIQIINERKFHKELKIKKDE